MNNKCRAHKPREGGTLRSSTSSKIYQVRCCALEAIKCAIHARVNIVYAMNAKNHLMTDRVRLFVVRRTLNKVPQKTMSPPVKRHAQRFWPQGQAQHFFRLRPKTLRDTKNVLHCAQHAFRRLCCCPPLCATRLRAPLLLPSSVRNTPYGASVVTFRRL